MEMIMAAPVLPIRKPIRTVPLDLLAKAFTADPTRTVQTLAAQGMLRKRNRAIKWLAVSL
jgi:hypothetical protein